jgi:EAL domain-containing protein (putative c-di-GMP-specific phosphodiesterase class I)
VETAGELEMLRSLGVEKAQGFYLGKLMSLEDALRVCSWRFRPEGRL